MVFAALRQSFGGWQARCRAGSETFLLSPRKPGDKTQEVAQGVVLGQVLQPLGARQKQIGGRQPQLGNTAGRRFDLAGLQERGGHRR